MKKLTFISALASLSLSLPLSATVIQFSAASAANGDRQAVLADGATLVSNSTFAVLAGKFAHPENFTFHFSASVQTNFNNMLLFGPSDPRFAEFGLVQPG